MQNFHINVKKLHNYCPKVEKLTMAIYNGNMSSHLSKFSAAIAWEIPCIDVVLGDMIEKIKSPDVTVSGHNARFRISGKKVHSCGLELPGGAITVLNGNMVSSPELLFLELACELSIHRLILLGLQMCSHKQGDPSEAITTKQKLAAFLAKTAGHRGQKKAMRAVKYIENGSASIMESLAFMILTLPHTLGGYGLDGAVFNHEILLTGEARKLLGQRRCFADLYYKQARVAVEYESFAHHNSPKEQGKDAIRSEALERMGIKVMHLNTIQLFDRNACRIFAYNIAKQLKKCIRIRSKSFDEMHTLLRALLPDRKLVPKDPDAEANG